MIKTLALGFAAILISAPLFAGDLINKDSKKYDLEINTGGSTTHTSINGNTNSSGGAKKGYTIKNKTTGSTLKVVSDGDVIIQNGQVKMK
jgi:hypothetical protein